MKNEEILEAAIKKACDNDPNFMPDQIGGEWTSSDAIFQLFGNRAFAKAFWGDEWVSDYGKTYKEYKKEVKGGMHYAINYSWQRVDFAWGYHLKQMVVQEDPIKYLEQFLK